MHGVQAVLGSRKMCVRVSAMPCIIRVQLGFGWYLDVRVWWEVWREGRREAET